MGVGMHFALLTRSIEMNNLTVVDWIFDIALRILLNVVKTTL